jgi:glycosyltransferase involved in cell wall biosynthesis
VDDIRDVWKRAHFAVLASRREGLPKSLLEAGACGRAMVATDTPGCREIAVEGETALTVPVDDAQALAGAMLRMAEDAEMRARFGKRARDLVEAKFSAELIGEKTIALYRSLVPAMA